MSSLFPRAVGCCLLALFVVAAEIPVPAAATNPCDLVSASPRPPVGPPEPAIAGSILDAATSTGVSGATVKLYRCQSTSAAYVTETTTTSTGAYSFGSLSQNWYFVEASLAGPLTGKSPASGTSNPSAPIEVWAGISGLNLSFE